MIGENVTWEEIEKKSGLIEVGDTKKKKSVQWFELYKFNSEDQYNEWKNWAEDELKKEGRENELLGIILQYSLNYPLHKIEIGAQMPLF